MCTYLYFLCVHAQYVSRELYCVTCIIQHSCSQHFNIDRRGFFGLVWCFVFQFGSTVRNRRFNKRTFNLDGLLQMKSNSAQVQSGKKRRHPRGVAAPPFGRWIGQKKCELRQHTAKFMNSCPKSRRLHHSKERFGLLKRNSGNRHKRYSGTDRAGRVPTKLLWRSSCFP